MNPLMSEPVVDVADVEETVTQVLGSTFPQVEMHFGI
jgi:hypothetical protein